MNKQATAIDTNRPHTVGAFLRQDQDALRVLNKREFGRTEARCNVPNHTHHTRNPNERDSSTKRRETATCDRGGFSIGERIGKEFANTLKSLPWRSFNKAAA